MLVKGSFEDFLYILAGVIWLAFSIYKGTKKKKSVKKEAKEPAKKNVFDTLMEEILDVQEKPQPEPLVYEDTVKEMTPSEEKMPEDEPDSKLFSYDDLYEQSNYNEVSEVITSGYQSMSIPETETDKPTTIERKSRFNLRKAVIYSAILNRPYS